MGQGFLCDKCDYYDDPAQKVEICRKCYASLLARASAWDSLPKSKKQSVITGMSEEEQKALDSVNNGAENGAEEGDGEKPQKGKLRVVVEKKKHNGKRKRRGKSIFKRLSDAVW